MGFRGSLGDRNLWLQSKGNFGYPWEGTLGPSSCSQNITSYCPIQPLYNPYIGNIMWVYISGALPRVPDFCLWYKIAPYETLPKTLLVLWGWSWRLDTFKPSWQGWQANPHHLGCYLSSSEISYLSSRNPNFFENQQKNNSKVRSKQRKKTWNFIDWSCHDFWPREKLWIESGSPSQQFVSMATHALDYYSLCHSFSFHVNIDGLCQKK